MHLPDGFISIPVAVSTGILSGGILWDPYRNPHPPMAQGMQLSLDSPQPLYLRHR